MTDDTLELGGNIELHGLSDVDSSELFVIKKIVGQYTKQLSERSPSFEQLIVTADVQDDVVAIDVQAQLGKDTMTSNSSDENLFFALTQALRELTEQV